MVVFSGTALGKAFSSTEAEDPFDLCHQLLPSSEPSKDYRMWIEISSPATGNKFWFDVCLNSMSTDIYKATLPMWDGIGEINTVIRGANEKSPNTSPDEKPKPNTPVGKSLPSTPRSYLEATLSNLTEATTEMTIAASSSYDTYGTHALNVIEPFSQEDISKASTNLIPLHFPNKENGRIVSYELILVDLDYLEMFVKTELEKNKKPTNLWIQPVKCRDGKERAFHLSAHVWIGSMLEHSASLRNIFSRSEFIDKAREEQLKELKQMELYAKVRYWIADMFDFEKASVRLGQRIEAQGISHFMSPYYFSEFEARYLNNLWVPGSAISLKAFLNKVAEEEDNICTSHNLAPKLMRIFEIEKNFHKKPSFQNAREAWMKAQEPIWRGSPKGPGEHFE